MSTATLGVPIKLLIEAEKHKITVEMKSGDIYRGLLTTSEPSMNLLLTSCLLTTRTGSIKKIDSVYLRGGGVRFIVLPDVLRNAPVFGKVVKMKKNYDEGVSKGGEAGGKRKRA